MQVGWSRDGRRGAFANVPCIDETFTNDATAAEFLMAAHPITDCGLMAGAA